jgi:hypothetical protein
MRTGILTLVAMVGLFPFASSAGEVVGVACFYDHPKGTPHDHPPTVWREVSKDEPLNLAHQAGEDYLLTCKDWQGVVLARVSSGTLHLASDSCCVTSRESGETCGYSVAVDAGHCRAALDQEEGALTVITCQGVLSFPPARVTAGKQEIVCHDSNGEVLAEVQPGHTVELWQEDCGFQLAGGLLAASEVLESPYGKCRGVLSDP